MAKFSAYNKMIKTLLWVGVILFSPAVVYAGFMYLLQDYVSPVILAAVLGLDRSLSFFFKETKR
jgi:hypothetical protein